MSFFDSDVAKIKLINRANLWYGAKFHLRACDPFNSVDCVNLALDLYKHAQFDPAIVLPQNYRADWGVGFNETGEMINEAVKESDGFDELAPELTEGLSKDCQGKNLRLCFDTKPGDLVVFKTKRTAHHCGIMVGYDYFIHAIRRPGVVRSSLSDSTYGNVISKVWRPK